MKEKLPRGKTGPEPERLKIEGNWEKAVGKALKAKKPEAAVKEVKKPPNK